MPTITSTGYPGSILPAAWAQIVAAFGADYGIADAASFKVTSVAATDRTVRIAAGTAYGAGLLDVLDADDTVQLDVVASGARWDTVALRRTWGATNATTLVAIQGTATKAISAGRNADPGTVDDQPIALVQVTAGEQLPTDVVDLRCWRGNGGMIAANLEALSYLSRPGSAVWISGVLWEYQVATNGTVSWDRIVPNAVLGAGGGALHGTYAGQRTKEFVSTRNWTTDDNGEVILMPNADFSGILRAGFVGSAIYPIRSSIRVDVPNGNLVAKLWDDTGLRTYTTIAGCASALYW